MGLRTASSDTVARAIFNEVSVQTVLADRLSVSVPVTPSVLRESMLREPGLRRWINRLMHPLVGEQISALEAYVVEVPLLFEACIQHSYREVWTVACGQQERARRLRQRYGPDADIQALGGWQLDETVKTALADVIIRTDTSHETVLKVLRAEAARCFPARIALP